MDNLTSEHLGKHHIIDAENMFSVNLKVIFAMISIYQADIYDSNFVVVVITF
jgi:hypothetical protein